MTDRAALCERVVDALGEAVLVLDRGGVIRLWNPGAEELFGHAAADVVGRPVDAIVPERFREAHRAGWERAMATGETKYGRRQVLETPVERADGSEIVVDLTVSFVTEGGEVSGMAAVARASDPEDDPSAGERQRAADG
ncbi:MAG: PAS domain S-box protein [Haloarculaceae archaeon]|jgi:PAS domain S-box-containing protein